MVSITGMLQGLMMNIETILNYKECLEIDLYIYNKNLLYPVCVTPGVMTSK